jgi:ribosomal protein L11 methylase PrmA
MPRKEHWDAVYATKSNDKVSWYEAYPTISLDLIQQVSTPPKSAIDVGGGQSFLVDRLLDLGISRIAVLDIANVALDRTRVKNSFSSLESFSGSEP